MKLVLIGGGEVGRGTTEYETKIIDEEIIKMTDKKNPTLLFVGLASSFSDSYYDVIKNNYKELGATPVYLKKNNLIHNPDLVKEKFQNADIIYIGGGDTLKLLEKIEEYNLKPLFDEAIKNNKVLVGISAGAILLSKKGYSDSYILREEKDTYEMIKGFKYTDLIISPHYHSDLDKCRQLEEYLKKHNEEVYGIENNSAIFIEDKKIRIVNSKKEADTYLITYKDKLIEKRPC